MYKNNCFLSIDVLTIIMFVVKFINVNKNKLLFFITDVKINIVMIVKWEMVLW